MRQISHYIFPPPLWVIGKFFEVKILSITVVNLNFLNFDFGSYRIYIEEAGVIFKLCHSALEMFSENTD